MTQKANSNYCASDQLVTKILLYLEKCGYLPTTIKKHENFYSGFLHFLKKKKQKTIDAASIASYLKFLEIPVTGKITNTQHYFKRSALRKLYQFKQTGAFNTKNNEWPPLPEYYDEILNEFVASEIEQKAISTISVVKMRRELRTFFHFLLERKIKTIGLLKGSHLQAFVEKLEQKFSRPSVISHIKYMRMLIRFLASTNQVSTELPKAVPKVRYIRKSRIPDVWPRLAVEKLLEAIDTNSDSGKRDYAICLLAVRLGIRIGDICSLKIEHINWERGILSFLMRKTKKRIELPLTEEVGTALIDYLKNGRPSVKDEQVIFLAHRPPFRPIGNGYNIINKHRKSAGIALDPRLRKGFHSLRYTLATQLHEASVPFSVISAMLGHSSLDITRIYAKANIEMLRSVALDWKEADNA